MNDAQLSQKMPTPVGQFLVGNLPNRHVNPTRSYPSVRWDFGRFVRLAYGLKQTYDGLHNIHVGFFEVPRMLANDQQQRRSV
jgi:hypothetical protein